MKYVQINSVPHGSTGAVMASIHREQLAAGNESWIMWGRGRAAAEPCEFNFGSTVGTLLDVAQTRLDGKAGFHSRRATKRLLAKLDEIDPDVVHLHNVHGYYLDVELLFAWLLRRGQRTRWTLHDCWAFTGHCAYFSAVGCEQWRGECGLESCPQLDTYPATISAASCHANFLRKRELFTSLPADRLTLIAPCRWLANLVGQSFLSKYPIEVRHNTVDTNIFKPSPSEFRQRHGLGDRFAVLGVASPWTERKGLDDFVRLAHDLDPQRFAIVLVGLSKKQRDRVAELAPGVVGLLRTDSPQELAQIYTACDVFFNPTREEVFCLVNLEAQACGTRVVSYDTGGCAEGLGPGNMAVAGYDEALTALMALCEWSHASNPVSGGGEQA